MEKEKNNTLNSIHPFIQFTMEVSKDCFTFPGILINKQDNKIRMNILSKPTNSKGYFPHDSNLPKPCLKNISFALVKRTYTLVENTNMNLIKLED